MAAATPDIELSAKPHVGASGRTLRILHVVSGLGPGGAETVLFRLITRSTDIDHEVICLGPREWYSDLLEAHGIPVSHVAFVSPWLAPSALARLYRLIKSSDADLVQGWMYRGNVFGGLLGRMAGKPVVWNLRCSDIHLYPLRTRVLARLGGFLARWIPTMVLNCSMASYAQHLRLGYGAVDGMVIPNGYDPVSFYPDQAARSATRDLLRVRPGTFLIGAVGRWDSQKAYPVLLRAVKLAHQRGVPLRLLLLGRGLDRANTELLQLIDEHDCAHLVSPLGYRPDIAQIARALDLHVLSSRTEGFPNVIAETMLSGTPNVATEAGDSALIVGKEGWVVASGDPDAFAEAIGEAHSEWATAPGRWGERRRRARRHIVKNFSLDRMVETYERVWRQVAQRVDLAMVKVENPRGH